MTADSPGTPRLAAEDLHCVYGGREVLSGVSVSFAAGERVAVVGPSGSGKSTLLTALAGVVPPTSGRVLVDGHPLADDPTLRHEIAIVLQGYGLVSLLTAEENIEVALRAQGHAPTDAIRLATQALSRVRLEDFGEHLVEELSGGQGQRVAIARALALAPRILVADEPTAEQDADNRNQVLRELLSAAEHGATVIVATHDTEVADHCDRVIKIHAGVIESDSAVVPA